MVTSNVEYHSTHLNDHIAIDFDIDTRQSTFGHISVERYGSNKQILLEKTIEDLQTLQQKLNKQIDDIISKLQRGRV